MVWFSSVALSFAVLIGAIIAPAAIAPAAIAPAASVALTSDSPPGFLLLWTRHSAHLAFAFLLLAFSAGTLKGTWPNKATRGLMRYRRQIGLGFATAHGFHLVALTLFLSNLESFSVDISLAVAGFGYAVTAALAVTSDNRSVRHLGINRWRLLHSTGINILMLYFFVAFSASLFTQPYTVNALYVLIIVIAVASKRRMQRETLALTTD